MLPKPALRPRAAKPCLSSAHTPPPTLPPAAVPLLAGTPSTQNVRLTPSYECTLQDGTALRRMC